MIEYAIADKITGEITQMMRWNDNRSFPTNIELKANEEVVLVEQGLDVLIKDVYDSASNQFYILDISDKEIDIEDIQHQLAELESVLSDFQEETWKALGVVETNLSQIWQDRLTQKRSLREQLSVLLGS